MSGWIAILLVAATTGLVAVLATRRARPRITTVTQTISSDESET